MNYYSMTLVVKTNAVVPTKDRGRHQRRESPTLNNQQKIFDLIRATGNESGTKSRRDWTRGEARADTSRRISRDWNQIHLYHSLIKCYLTNASSHSTPLALPAKYQETSSAFVYWSICVWIVELGLSKSCNNSYFKTWRHPPPFIWCENDDEWSDWCHADEWTTTPWYWSTSPVRGCPAGCASNIRKRLRPKWTFRPSLKDDETPILCSKLQVKSHLHNTAVWLELEDQTVS